MPSYRLRAFLVPVLAVLAVSLVPVTGAAGAGPLPTRVTAEPSATRVQEGAAVTVAGSVTPVELAAGRAVALELETASGWREVARGVTDPTGSYVLPVPTDFYASHQLRVVAPATQLAQAGASDVRNVTVTPTYDPRGNESAWKQFPSRARWDPCSVIEYRTNLRRAPKGSQTQVARAFAAVEAATGLSFRRAGKTKKVPYSRGPESRQFLPAGLVVAWSTPRSVPALRGRTAGIGGATARSVNGGPWEYAYGGVSIDATQKLPGRKRTSLRTLLMHEIAHAVGLTHVSDKSQVMYPSLLRSHRARFEAGDLAGLRAVGAEQGCL